MPNDFFSVHDIHISDDKWEAILSFIDKDKIGLSEQEIKASIFFILWIGVTQHAWSVLPPVIYTRFNTWNKKKLLAKVLECLDHSYGWEINADRYVYRQLPWPMEYHQLGIDEGKGILNPLQQLKVKIIYDQLVKTRKIKCHVHKWLCCLEMFFWKGLHPKKTWVVAAKRYGLKSGATIFSRWNKLGVWAKVLQAVGQDVSSYWRVGGERVKVAATKSLPKKVPNQHMLLAIIKALYPVDTAGLCSNLLPLHSIHYQNLIQSVRSHDDLLGEEGDEFPDFEASGFSLDLPETGGYLSQTDPILPNLLPNVSHE